MADSEEESTNSESNWPMNEDWMIEILKGDNKSDDKVTINVCDFVVVVFSLARVKLILSPFPVLFKKCQWERKIYRTPIAFLC